MIRYDTIRYGMIRYDTIRYGTVRYDTIRHDTVGYDTVRYDTIWFYRWGPTNECTKPNPFLLLPTAQQPLLRPGVFISAAVMNTALHRIRPKRFWKQSNSLPQSVSTQCLSLSLNMLVTSPALYLFWRCSQCVFIATSCDSFTLLVSPEFTRCTSYLKLYIITFVMYEHADPSGRAAWDVRPGPVVCRFESRRGNGRLPVSCECCMLSRIGLRPTDHSSRGDPPTVVCLSVIVKLRQWGGPGPLGLSSHGRSGPGVDSASNKNEYQKYFLGVGGVKAAGV
jgi:hypothetical protein